MPPDTPRAGSSLAQAICGEVDLAPTKLRALHELARSNFADGWGTDNLSEALKLANSLVQRLKAEIAKQNATPHWEDTFLRWWRDERIDPIKFYALTMVFMATLPGRRPPMAQAREHALLLLRPDLFFRQGVICQPDSTPAKNRIENTSHLVSQMRKERQALSKKLKGMMEKPPSDLASIFAQIRESWEAAIDATRRELGAELTPVEFQKVIKDLAKVSRAP